MKNRSYHDHFAVNVWSRDCEIPEHRVMDVDYRIIKTCDLCTIYREMVPMDYVRIVLHSIWMDLEAGSCDDWFEIYE